MGELFNLIFVNPLINALVAIYLLLDMINLPYALGFSIIVLTAVIRLVMWPFTAKQLEVTKKMQAVSPELSKLKEKHKGDAKRLQQETMLLYQKHGVNPFGGCLPTLIQFLLFPALYSVFQTFVGGNKPEIMEKFNSVLYIDVLKLHELQDPTFFGLPLGQSPGQLFSLMPLVLLIPLLTALLQFAQSKMMFPAQIAPQTSNGKGKEPDFQTVFQKQIVYIIPVTIGFAAYNFPIGLSLYWNTFSVFAMIQQYKISGLGGLRPMIDRFTGNKKV
ncbi:MAG: YidC/Oxa1 family membrane protein insertase [Candidatus Levybacteria bacterium]|nr:YidC/Oxa1 family membrane protein insertase [Candidatus Levybacteria bacterium]